MNKFTTVNANHFSNSKQVATHNSDLDLHCAEGWGRGFLHAVKHA